MGMLRSDLVKSHTIHEDSVQRNTEAIGKVTAKVVELEQKVARGVAGGGGEAGDRCKKSFFPDKRMHLGTFGALEKPVGGGGGVLDQPCRRPLGATLGRQSYARRHHWELEICKRSRSSDTWWWTTSQCTEL